MQNNLATALFATLLASTLTAQGTAVFPGDYTNPSGPPVYLNGSSSTSQYPFSSGVARTMYVYESWDLAIPDGAKITQVGFPRDERFASLGAGVQLEICIGATMETAATAQPDFDKNYLRPPTVNFTKKIFTLPALGSTGVDEVVVPLDVPHVFNKSENLVVEYRVHANSNSNGIFSYYLDVGGLVSPVTSFGAGCAGSGGKVPLLVSRATSIGGSWRLDLTQAPASAATILTVGLAVLPQPFPIPGAPGCDLHILPLLVIPASTTSAGSFRPSFKVPDRLSLYHAVVRSQCAIVDLFANATGLVMSNGDEMQIGADPRCAMITVRGSATATRGSLQRNYGQIALFDWQP